MVHSIGQLPENLTYPQTSPVLYREAEKMLRSLEKMMDEKLLGKCGFYCGCCPTYIKGGCFGDPLPEMRGNIIAVDYRASRKAVQ